MIGPLAEVVVRRAGVRRARTAAARHNQMVSAESHSCLGSLLHEALVKFKTNVAFVETRRKKEVRRLTYLQVKHQASAIARRLHAAGLQPGDRVAILMSNQSRWLLGACAALFRGLVLVPLDCKLTASEQTALLRHAKPRALLTEYGLYQALPRAELPSVDLVLVHDAPDEISLEGAERWDRDGEPDADTAPLEFVPRQREDLATIVYSSGTSGQPKGCMLTHGSYLAQYTALSRQFPFRDGDRYLSILPTNHAIDFMVGFVGALCGGATVVHPRALRPEYIIWAMQEYRITHMAVVPLVLEAFERRLRERLDQLAPVARSFLESLTAVNARLTERSPRPRLSRTLLRPIHDAFGGDLEYLICGGAYVDPRRVEFFYRLGIPVVVGYGLTEACTVATVNPLSPFRADSVGSPLPGVHLQIRAPNEEGVGEVLLRGENVMQGYLDDPERTAAALRDGWLHTGDLGRLDAAGHLHLVGRSKNMIVTPGGKNIYPEDVEAAFDGLPYQELAVFGTNYVWPDRRLDEESLFVVVRAPDEDYEAVRRGLRQRNQTLAEYRRVRGLLRWATNFPRTASLKLKRPALAAEIREAQAPDGMEPL